METLSRRLPWSGGDKEGRDSLLTREWLVTNGLGGYASGTISGVSTRRYHGLLVAALPAPLGRMLMLSHLSEQIRLPDGTVTRLGGLEAVGALNLYGAEHLTEFRLELGLPVWTYNVSGIVLEKQILLPHEQNTVHVTYRLREGKGPVRLKLMPSMHFRSHDAPVSEPLPGPLEVTARDNRISLQAADTDIPCLRMQIFGRRPAFTIEKSTISEQLYRIEQSRGYAASGELHIAGYFRIDLDIDSEVTLVASTENWDTICALAPRDALRAERERRVNLLAAAHPAARTGLGAELVLAADQFLVKPSGRVEDAARARAEGDDVRTVIAGYHWFTDWGRDTMISLEGLTLTTGRVAEAGYLLRTFAHYVRDGLIPNLFPEGHKEGLYHTADATLWFFHALDRYLAVSQDRITLRSLLPRLIEIAEHHLRGTRFGIGIDPADGLFRQGAQGYQLTWMDAKVGDWVVTPRRGKAVELSALWYNALRLLERWVGEEQGESAARVWGEQADRTRQSFNERFWYQGGGYLYDVIDGEDQETDSACRPNQLFAISLPHPALDESRWEPVLRVVQERLLTPVGLRSLAPGHADYKPIYYGDLRARDAAYHQGTVWGWLVGPFVDAWLKVHPHDIGAARSALEGFEAHLNEACIGSISEIFDAEAPFTPRGCVAQAWSVAEVLRCWVKTAAY